MARVLNMRDGKGGGIRVDRATRWGNPFRMSSEADRLLVVERYRRWLLFSDDAAPLRRDLHTLKGADLMCWCAPKPCHADVLLALANDAETLRLIRD